MLSSRRFKSFAVLAPLSVSLILAAERPAEAVLTYYIYESGPNVVVQTSGSLNLPSPLDTGYSCIANGAIAPIIAGICTGAIRNLNLYGVSGPSSFGVGFTLGDSAAGPISTLLQNGTEFQISDNYVSGTPIVSSATFNSKTVVGLGITATGLLGTWTLAGTGDTINVVVGAPPAPGPLPLFGAAAAFGYSRRLRRRVNQAPASAPLSGTISA
jgi:hypothetical protein